MSKFKGKKVLILGSGGLKIGQAGEFDYSGSQAIKALKEQGIKVVLINPNIATVQTDTKMADVVYLEPLNIRAATTIIEKEKPDGIFLSFGGQTALNLGLELERLGVFKKYNIAVLGTSTASIKKTEDRDLFKESLSSINVKTAKSFAVLTTEEALLAANTIGYPVMMRSGYSLGGLGSGKVENETELKIKAQQALAGAPQILIEEYLGGWKEIEYEVVRDCEDNAITVCNMENFDPMGIHTGESIVVAPSQTLSNNEYHLLRDIAIRCAKHFSIVGECNIQYALNPENGDYRVIEMNARLSRSSALASKATGYPLAFVAAKLALGFKLYEITNAVTQKTCAFFEPSLDYIALKIPRWDTHKLRSAERTIGSEMKSVGEVMAIGRSFPETLQKAIRMLNIGTSGLCDYPETIEDEIQEIKQATDRRLFALYKFFLKEGSVEEAFALSKINPWFLHHIKSIAELQQKLSTDTLNFEILQEAKKKGFSDKSIASFTQTSEKEIRKLRINLGILPHIKQIDTLAGEFDAATNYLYVTYHGTSHDVSPSEKSIITLGSGPYCIGSSVEFDWCAVNTSKTLRSLDFTSIVINSNPETVSTDYDESDRLYFEELTLERVQDIADFESPKGLIVSVGGQIANNLAMPLHQSGYHLLGTHPFCIDHAENRKKFSSLLSELHIDQPIWESVTSFENAKNFAKKVGYPILIRPSYVLSGAAMNVVFSDDEMAEYLKKASIVSPDHPVVMSQFIAEAKELEVDGVAEKGQVVIEAISEHVENAGVHSGDATIVLPPQRLYLETIRKAKKITRQIVSALSITGPFNIQFIAKNNDLKVIECNVRASRSFPFVSKVTQHNFIDISTRILVGHHSKESYETLELDYVGVKAPQFSYSRLKGASPVAHVEMASTGEVACLGDDLHEAFFKSWLATDQSFLKKKLLISIGHINHKAKLMPLLKELEDLGWEFYATEGTHHYLCQNGIASSYLYKASEKIEPNITTALSKRFADIIINIPKGTGHNSKSDGYKIRRLAIDNHLPLITNLQLATLFLQCLIKYDNTYPEPKSLQEFYETRKTDESLIQKKRDKIMIMP